jgi:hypothetical protein
MVILIFWTHTWVRPYSANPMENFAPDLAYMPLRLTYAISAIQETESKEEDSRPPNGKLRLVR